LISDEVNPCRLDPDSMLLPIIQDFNNKKDFPKKKRWLTQIKGKEKEREILLNQSLV
jgi:hypothetical protein